LNIFILTDLEGPAGVERFAQTRTTVLEEKAEAMEQLSREVNACIEGIRAIHSEATIIVWDGHGTGGLLGQEIRNAEFIPHIDKPYLSLAGFDAMFFVGQHAMAGTYAAPLCHTYSSRYIEYYKLNGVFVGEFAGRALLAALQGVPTVFLSGDDKAALEAQTFIPDMETVTVKWGLGLEAATHLDKDESCRRIREGASRAAERIGKVEPLIGFSAPYRFEARYAAPEHAASWKDTLGARYIDDRTVEIVTEDAFSLPF
jgi:D-amino peptidase